MDSSWETQRHTVALAGLALDINLSLKFVEKKMRAQSFDKEREDDREQLEIIDENNNFKFCFRSSIFSSCSRTRKDLPQDLRECNSLGIFEKKLKAYFSSLGSHTVIMKTS